MTSARILPFRSGRTERHRAGFPSARPVANATTAKTLATPVSVKAAATPTLTQRGYVILYRDGQVNHCPACGKTHWWIGNRSAECAFCATAIDLQRV